MTEPTSSNAPDPLVRAHIVQFALGVSELSLRNMVAQGRLPKPAVTGPGRYRLWRLSQLRAANPALADSVELLLKLPFYEKQSLNNDNHLKSLS